VSFRFDERLTRPEGRFERFQVTAGVAALRAAPEPDAEMLSQALGGDIVRVFDEDGEFGRVQMERDGYVGWALMDALSAPALEVTHRISALRTYVFSEPSIKSAPRYMLCQGAHVAAEGEEGRFLKAARAGYVVRDHCAELSELEDQPGQVALRYRHTPYLWGGKESLGLDCSGLVQMAFAACGVILPRDTDMQFALAGQAVGDWQAPAVLQAGDLVFWTGHVGIMLDGETLIHANAYHMAVAVEPLASAIDRIAPLYGQPTGARRLDLARACRDRPDWLDRALGKP
jgi:hypothetical protein